MFYVKMKPNTCENSKHPTCYFGESGQLIQSVETLTKILSGVNSIYIQNQGRRCMGAVVAFAPLVFERSHNNT